MMSLTTIHKFLSVALAAGALLLGADFGTAQAGKDTKVYTGDMCRPLLSSANVSYEADGSIVNRSKQASVTVLCPIIRDTTTNRNGLSHAVVWFDGHHKAKYFSCKVQSRRRLDNRLDQEVHKTGRINYFGTMTINMRGLGKSHRSTFYTLHCKIPPILKGSPPSRLLNYSVEEGDAD